MNKPNTMQTQRELVSALFSHMSDAIQAMHKGLNLIKAELEAARDLDLPAGLREAKAKAAPMQKDMPENPHPPRRRGRPVKYHSQAERVAALRAQRKAAFARWIAKPANRAKRQAQQRARLHAAAKTTQAEPPRLCTPGDMPRQPLRVGACYALGMRYSAIAAALDMPKGSLRNAMHRFNQHAGLTTIDNAGQWFAAMRADPADYAPHADRRAWAMAYAKRATTEAKRKAARKAWKARRRA